jgi:hypothetical protein
VGETHWRLESTRRLFCCGDSALLLLPQVRVAYDVFMLSGVLEELGIPESELTGFLSAVSAHYHSPEEVPYHNLAHVVQVLHAVWLVSTLAQAAQTEVVSASSDTNPSLTLRALASRLCTYTACQAAPFDITSKFCFKPKWGRQP